MTTAFATKNRPSLEENGGVRLDHLSGEFSQGDSFELSSTSEVGNEGGGVRDAFPSEKSNGEERAVHGTVSPTGEPIPDYLRLNVPEILDRIMALDPGQIGQVIAYEKAHRNRKTLLIKLGRMLRPPKNHAAREHAVESPTA